MHFVSEKTGGYRVYAVTGINTVSFAIDFREADPEGLLGFAVERHDPKEDQRYYVYGMKVFRSVIPRPDETTSVSTYDHPIQSFVWDDFTAKEGRDYVYYFHPLKGKPKNIDRGAEPIRIAVQTEPLFSDGEHDIFFNRGVASSQAYSRRFDNKSPDEIEDPKKREEALQWLSRDLDDALLRFIDGARPGDTILGCFYEFRYLAVAQRLKQAIDRGITVRLILDAKDNESTDKDGKHKESFPKEENKRTVKAAKLPASAIARWRKNNPSSIQHNKFMILLRGSAETPAEVWTGSTNLSVGGIHGQTNVGHWVRNAEIAAAFRDYWNLLQTDPGSKDGDDRKTSTARKTKFREAVMELREVPQTWQDIPEGTSAVFSPRRGDEVLEMYAAALDQADSVACVTLAFGVNKRFKDKLVDNDADSHVSFLLLEKQDKPNPRSKAPFIELKVSHNVYQAWGSYLRDALYQWTRETNARTLSLNTHVSYVHSKFLLKDPLGEDPIVITGSANFSDPSINDNDENMLLIRGNERVADIYFTEFNRLFFHYYFRSIQQASLGDGRPSGAAAESSLFLRESDDWLDKYKPGKLRRKRVEIFVSMANAKMLS
ncbi:phospholipase D-like domain-containing protein [Bradyrhizobium sp. LHD-71]|uniref:phospholipase D-like domain-containing protein n=1 Tax=Bradyrhizobium sp. LHD-71 TaxID=3072141 RepID=UPI00280DD241|nr:phospholipase D-like domain-containing protein [Bradyrhizobium sp. LHD-71]MDQ8730209.1 phospholipase D-like domain-containing protein [Bradyrhizobium sp. LHD-71]